MNGAATNPDLAVVARAGAQVKNALDLTIKLGGENYVFWGGREGYMSLLNTDMKRELDHLARFLHLAKDYARKQGFRGTFDLADLVHRQPLAVAIGGKLARGELEVAGQIGVDLGRDADEMPAGRQPAG